MDELHNSERVTSVTEDVLLQLLDEVTKGNIIILRVDDSSTPFEDRKLEVYYRWIKSC